MIKRGSKKLLVIASFVIIITSIMFTQAYCQNPINQYVPNSRIKENSVYENQLKDYVDNSRLKIKLQYPYNWTYKENQSDTSIEFQPNSTEVSPLLYISMRPANRTSLDTAITAIIDNLKQSVNTTTGQNNRKILNFSSTSITGHDTYQIEYAYGNNLTNLYGRAMEIYSAIGDMIYTIIYSGGSTFDYNTYLDNAKEIIDSVTYLSNSIPNINKGDISLLQAPTSIAVNPSTNKIYLGSELQNVISIVSEGNDKVIKTLNATNAVPTAIAINPEAERIYVANSNSNSLSVIDGLTDNYQYKIPVGKAPSDIAIDTFLNPIDWIFVSNENSSSVSVIEGNAVIDNIAVGKKPTSLAINPNTRMLYVANSDSDYISVIDYALNDNGTFTKRTNIEPIYLGYKPLEISLNPKTNKLYVINSDGNAISIIDGLSYVIKKTVRTNGTGTMNIAINPVTNKVYVPNLFSNTVSVIDGSTDVLKSVIPVGSRPSDISVNPNTNTIYVANVLSRSFSIIDGKTDQIIAGADFNVDPANAGYIECNNEKLSSAHIRLLANTNCKAKSNAGFTFISWSENSPSGSNKIILSNSSWPPSLSHSLLSGLSLVDDNSTTLPVDHSGNFTANFQANPPPIPQNVLIGIYGLAATIFTGWFVPNFARWINSIKQRRHMADYLREIRNIGNIDNETSRNTDGTENKQPLEAVKTEVATAYAEGKISEVQYKILNEQIALISKREEDKTVSSLHGDRRTRRTAI